MKLKTKVKCALDIAKNALDEIEMQNMRRVHIEASLLHGICNVWPCESQVLKRTSNTVVADRIGHERPVTHGEFRPGVNGSSGWVAMSHANPLKDLLCILPLGKEKALCGI